MNHDLLRRLTAELIGTALLVAVIVGSGIAAQRLSPDDVGLQLLENSTATALGLAVLILMFGPVSGAHFNPVVSAADWLLGRRYGTGLAGREVLAYSAAQVVGGIAGAVLANLMFQVSITELANIVDSSSDPYSTSILQAALTTLGYEPGPIDGRYGRASKEAVRNFQSAAGIGVDSLVGPQTWSRLQTAACKLVEDPAAPTEPAD